MGRIPTNSGPNLMGSVRVMSKTVFLFSFRFVFCFVFLGLGGLGGGFGAPGGGVRTGRSGGKATAGTCAKKNTPRSTKTTTRTTKTRKTKQKNKKTLFRSGPVRKIREACRNNFRLFSPRSEPWVQSYTNKLYFVIPHPYR